MRKRMNHFLLLFAGLLLFLGLPLQSVQVHAAIDKDNGVNYLALGDSLASGVTPYDELGEGYTDFLAQKLNSIDALLTFNKGFTKPGYTSTNVLNDIQDNVTKDVIGIGSDEKTAKIQDSIANADIITLSVGANDVLGHLDINAETGDFAFDQIDIFNAVQKVGKNYAAILTNIYNLNPNVQLYVMGYYNPFPYLDEEVQPKLDQLLGLLNGSIKGNLAETGAVFIQTAGAIDQDFETYLPNPKNIHLSTEGYQVVADLFWEAMNKPTFSDVNEDWAIEYVEKAAALGLVKGYDDGRFKPYNQLTRAQAASILTRALDLKATTTAPFKDIKGIDKNTKEEINAAYSAKLIKGYDGGKFKPNNNITRAQMALMIQRAIAYAEVEIEPGNKAPFKDIDGYDQEAIDAISLLYNLDIVSGNADRKYMPGNPTSRQQAAKMFVNTVKVLRPAN